MDQTHIEKSDKDLIFELQSRLDELRERLGVSARGELLFREDLFHVGDRVVVVEADGYGGAVLRVVEGNYPLDYLVREEKAFSTEAEAEDAAETLCA
jgi:hypothetical protein